MNVEEAEKTVQELWDSDVPAWNTYWVPIFRKFSQELVHKAQLHPGQLILDVGTGTGIAALEAAKRIERGFVIGIDRSHKMINIARANANKNQCRNAFFIEMNGDQLLFPNRLFARVMSNCGISSGTFPRTVREISRVIRDDGIFILNDFHLIEVAPHRIFSEILRAYRTDNPSRKLSKWREALATLESLGNRYSDSKETILHQAGFKRIKERTETFRIDLPSTQDYLRMRFQRIALRQELIELAPDRRRKFLKELRKELAAHTHKGRFTFKWKVDFTIAAKE